MAKILIIDDDPDLREMLQLFLSQSDHQVLLASDGLEGLRLAWENQPDLILLDVVLPTVDGHQVLRRLKSMPETKAIPVIMLTAVTAARQVQDLIGSGADDYIIKPFEPYALLQRLKRIVPIQPGRTNVTGSETVAGRDVFALVAARDDWRVSLLARYLAEHGSVEVTSSGLDALAIAIANCVPLILAEPFLADLDGPDLVRRLRGTFQTATAYLVALADRAQAPAERARLLGAGFDEVLVLPPTPAQVRSLAERTKQPRSSLARVRDGVVVLAVLSLSGAAAIRRLRDAMLDFQQANLNRVVIDLTYADGAGAALGALGPFFSYLVGCGLRVRLAVPLSVIENGGESLANLPPLFASVEEALDGWA